MKKLILLFMISFLSGKIMSAGFIISSTSWCTSSTITFTDTTTNQIVVDWVWYFGDDSTFSGLGTANHVYKNSGTYTVSCKTIYSDNSSDSVTQMITIHGVQADFTADKVFEPCVNLSTQFSNLSMGDSLSYQWNFGDTLSLQYNNSTVKDPLHTFHYGGYYNVTLIATDIYLCSDTMVKENYIYLSGPYGTFQYDTTFGNIPLMVKFSFDISEADTLIFFYGDGTNDLTTFIGAPMKHVYTQNGFYVPFFVLIKWVFDSHSGKMERCTIGYSGKDTIFVYGHDKIQKFNTKNELLCYPNPAKEQIMLDYGQNSIEVVCIYDVMGREIKRIIVNSKRTVLDVSDLQIGMYVIKISTNNGILTKKIRIKK